MNITQLRYFHAVADYHTVSLAAQHLYISQPSLSNAIKELEREFSVTLFYRRHNGMFLSPEGTKLYNSTRELLGQYADVEQMMRNIGKGERRLRLGIPPMISSFVFPKLYKYFFEHSSDTELAITEKGHYELLDKLNDGLVDIVILPHTKPFDVSLAAKRIGTLDIVCCTSARGPLAAFEELDAQMLDGEPLVLFPDTFLQTRTIKRWFMRSGVSPTVSVQTEQLSTALGVIESGIASGFMFKRLAEGRVGLVTLPLSPQISVDVSIIRKKDGYVSQEMRMLENYFEENKLI